MANIFGISDTHFSHVSMFAKFKLPDGSPMRPFTSKEEMDELMIQNWNRVVRDNDKVYHFGDVTMKPEFIPLLARCRGKKRLILGNHDESDMTLYAPYFDAIYSSRRIDSMLWTHIPVHPLSLDPRLLGNVHGHVHNNVPAGHFGPRYLNISVEVINYTPIAIEDMKRLLRKQLEDDHRLKVIGGIMQVG